MKRLHFERWSGTFLPPRNPRLTYPSSLCIARSNQSSDSLRLQRQPISQICQRCISTSVRSRQEQQVVDTTRGGEAPSIPISTQQNRVPRSAKLAALHARLSLPARFPLQTLARCLIHPSADSRPEHNNSSLAILGQELLAYHTSEWLICNYPRIPMPILLAALDGYVGPKTLGRMRVEWGVENAAAPGEEVDKGLLQFQHTTPGNKMTEDMMHQVKEFSGVKPAGTGRPNESWNYRRGMSSRIVYDDEFGDLQSGINVHDTAYDLGSTASPSEKQISNPDSASPLDSTSQAVTQQDASASFIRAVFGALYLHAGQPAVQPFHEAHVLSRYLPLHTLFDFKHPTRDLSRLCSREGFDPPVARLISETGRHSRTPVFIVGVYSGQDKLGEDAGSSLDEGRVRAAAQALRSWYLYSPPRDDVCLPSRQAEMEKQGKRWRSQMVDPGEIIT